MSTTRHRTALLVAVLAATAALLLSACSGGSGDANASVAPAPASSDGPQGRQGFDPSRAGTSGQIAAVNGMVMQVRSTDSQTSVTWTDSTTFTAEVSGALSDVSVGTCVLAVPDPTTASDSTDASAPIAATSIRITDPADDGTCTAGFGGGGFGPGGAGGRPSDLPNDLPTDLPSDLPSGLPGGAGMFAGIASGAVSAIDGDTLTVDAMGPDGTATTRTVTVSSGTTYTHTVTSDASAIVVGQCATVRGEQDDSGQVTAQSVSVSAPTDGACTSGFGSGFPGGFGGRPGDAGQPGGGNA